MLDKLDYLLKEELKHLDREDVYELTNKVLNKINEEALKAEILSPKRYEIVDDARSIYKCLSYFSVNITCYEREIPFDSATYYACSLIDIVDKLSIKYGIKKEKQIEMKLSTK